MKVTSIFGWTLSIILIAGCATSERTKFAGQGCAGGTVIGALSGVAIAGTQGAIIGAIGGCVAGLLTGLYFAKRKEQYATQQQAILQETAWNREMAQKIRQTNIELAKSIQQYKQEVKRIKNMPMNKKTRQMVLRKEQQKFQQRFGAALDVASRLKMEVGKSNQRYKQYQANAAPATLAKWQTEITAFEEQGNRLDNNLNLLVSMNNSL